MRIVSSENLNLASEYRFVAGREINESLDLQQNGQRLQISRHERSEVSLSAKAQVSLAADRRAVSEQDVQRLAQGMPQRSADAAEAIGTAEALDFSPNEADLLKLRMLLIALGRLNEQTDAILKVPGDGGLVSSPGAQGQQPPSQQAASASLSYNYSVSEWRGEELEVNASGRVHTADGRQIDFGMSMRMSNVQFTRSSVSLNAGATWQDPLVVNLAGGPVQLQPGARSRFDLDADGKAESMAQLGAGSAFLALDRNGNGRIDDGRELFGALSGDGFADLQAYDEDGNGFIDEGDSIFSELRLWRPTADGAGQLLGLQQAGIGALGLARAYGDFDLLVGSQLEGRVRSTGLFLFENGQVGSLQQIDLAV